MFNLKKENKRFFFSFTNFFKKTKNLFFKKIQNIFFKKKIDDEVFLNIKEILLLADVGISTTNNILKKFKKKIQDKNIVSTKEAYLIFKQQLCNILLQVKDSVQYHAFDIRVILCVGVNGVGKTSTLVKLAYFYQKKKKRVLLVAGDTFRAAAIDQLKEWGKLYKIPVFYKSLGIDPSSVIFDSLRYALIKKFDMILIDTAGRLHNKLHLMQELQKMDRVIKKYNAIVFQETILILDACIGQNSIQQTRFFNQIIPLSSIIITKLDGTAKGGILLAIVNEFYLPIKYICIGESIEDLVRFNVHKFIESLF
ncbi:signal recognition particle-docking protein FtsY [Buchnera aphidicola]|uniref:signal recognition particle-docking protein FtsY n=1 Tax=Buchnera aphidicola TaxID=9 RepID=UPI0031B710E2